MGINLTNNNQGGYVRVRRTSPSISGAGAWCGYYLLNAYPGAVAAYSLRRLRKEYIGPLIRVRRSSDNAETDIGCVFNLDGEVLDEATLTAFVGGGNGFVTKWYDQSGNAVDQARTIQNQQPQIVTNGTVYKDNGRPAAYFNGNMSMRSVNSISLTSIAGEWSTFGVSRVLDFSFPRVLLSFDGIAILGDVPLRIGQFLRSNILNFESIAFRTTAPRIVTDLGLQSNSNQNILNSIRRTDNVEIYVNGVSNGSTSIIGTPEMGVTPLDLGYRNGIDASVGFLPFGYIQELIHYNMDVSSYYQNVLNFINSYYNVY